MKFLALLRRQQPIKRRRIQQSEQELLIKQGRVQFKKLLGYGLGVPVASL